MANEPTKNDGILGTLKDAAKWWLGDGMAAEAADDVDSRNRRKKVECVRKGGRWDNETQRCVMPNEQ